MFGNFVIGCGVVSVADTLDDLSRGRAITLVFLGRSVASAIGLPLSAWIGETFGWQALNTSAISVGQAVGAASGGWLSAHDGYAPLHWFGLAWTGAAILLSLWALRHKVSTP